MKQFLLIFTLLLFSAVPAYAQVTAKILADKQVQAGDLVVLDGSHSTNAVHYVWKLINSDKKFLVFENGTKLITAIGVPGEYRFLLIVVGQDNNNRITVADFEWTLEVVGTKPVPTPQPTPTPQPVPVPAPVVPDDQFDNLGKSIIGWSGQYLKPNGKTIASQIGDNYLAVAKGLTEGDILLKDTFSKVAELNKPLYNTQEVHDQFILIGSRINEVYVAKSSTFDRDTMVEFLKVVGNSLKAIKE